jgi:hypothetical protein
MAKLQKKKRGGACFGSDVVFFFFGVLFEQPGGGGGWGFLIGKGVPIHWIGNQEQTSCASFYDFQQQVFFLLA